jgi:hypothetical protein
MFFSFPNRPDPHWGAHPALYIKINGEYYPGDNSPGHECDHLTPPRPGVTNVWSHTSTSLCVYGVHTNNFASALHTFMGYFAHTALSLGLLSSGDNSVCKYLRETNPHNFHLRSAHVSKNVSTRYEVTADQSLE